MSCTYTIQPINFKCPSEIKLSHLNKRFESQFEQIFDLLPEAKEVNELSNQFFNALHRDENIDGITKFFELRLFHKKDPRTMFFLYKNAVINYFEKIQNENLNKLANNLKEKFNKNFDIPDFIIREQIKKLVDKNFSNFHKEIPRLAIAKATHKETKEIDLSKELAEDEKENINIVEVNHINNLLIECLEDRD